MSHTRCGSKGFTLIEMMISLTIGAIVTFTGLTLYSQMSKSSSKVRAESLIQENAYFLQQTLRQYLNQAGYRPEKSAPASSSILPVDTLAIAFPEVVGDWGAGEYIRPDANGFTIRFKGSSKSDGSADGSVIDCQRTAIDESALVEVSFMIYDGTLICKSAGQNVVMINNDDGITVPQFALTFGVDTANDGSADQYIDASLYTDQGPIKVVRLSFLLASVDSVLTNSTEYTFNGTTITPTDKLSRHVVDIWAELRN